MWLFCHHGYYSIVSHQDDPQKLVVRSRVRGDIERCWPAARVVESTDRDYRFRAVMERGTVQTAIDEMVKSLKYNNFKDSIGDKTRQTWYLRVWMTLGDMQDCMLRKGR